MRLVRVLAVLTAAALAVSSVGATGSSTSPFSVIVLPDTQHYSESYPETFDAQTKWIVEQREARNIQFVAHVGDLVNSRSKSQQYINADAAIKRLDAAGIPYGVLPGNHDGQQASDSLFHQYFGESRYASRPWHCGSTYYGATVRVMGTCQLFSAGGVNWVVLHLGWMQAPENLATRTTLDPETGDAALPAVGVNKTMLRWAHAKLQEHSARRAIVAFHGYLDGLGKRLPGYDKVFDLLVKPNPNVTLVLNGHELGTQAEHLRTDVVNGRSVHQMLANYQSRPRGGDGWLRILTFDVAGRVLRVETYSPTRNEFETDQNSRFDVALGENVGEGAAPNPPSAPRNLRILTSTF
jgi:3',5'-cyclic AMP phosphodiesterase CpdA